MKNKIIIALVFLLISCGTRKVNKINIEETKVEQLAIVDSASSIKTDTTTITNHSIENNIEYEPINETEEYIVKGQVYKNVKIKASNKTIDTNIQKNIKEVTNQSKTIKAEVKTTKASTQKDIKKINNEWIYLLIILLVVTYIYLKYYNKL